MRRKTLKLFYIPKRQNRGFKNNKKQKLIDILLKAEKLWLIIPLILYGIGFFIHKVYLSNYNTFDFEIIQTKYIYIGIIFTIYILLFILLMTLSVGNPRNSEKQELIIISSWLIRIPILAFCIYFLIYDFDTVNNDIKLLLGKYFTHTLLSIIHSIILLLALLYVSWFLFYNYSKLLKDKNIDKAIKIFFSIVLIPLAFTALTYATISQNFSRLLGFLLIPFFLILIFGLL